MRRLKEGRLKAVGGKAVGCRLKAEGTILLAGFLAGLYGLITLAAWVGTAYAQPQIQGCLQIKPASVCSSRMDATNPKLAGTNRWTGKNTFVKPATGTWPQDSLWGWAAVAETARYAVGGYADSARIAGLAHRAYSLQSAGATGLVYTSGAKTYSSPLDATGAIRAIGLQNANQVVSANGTTGGQVLFSMNDAKGQIYTTGAYPFSFGTNNTAWKILTVLGKDSMVAGGDLYSPTATFGTGDSAGRAASGHFVSHSGAGVRDTFLSAMIDTVKPTGLFCIEGPLSAFHQLRIKANSEWSNQAAGIQLMNTGGYYGSIAFRDESAATRPGSMFIGPFTQNRLLHFGWGNIHPQVTLNTTNGYLGVGTENPTLGILEVKGTVACSSGGKIGYLRPGAVVTDSATFATRDSGHVRVADTTITRKKAIVVGTVNPADTFSFTNSMGMGDSFILHYLKMGSKAGMDSTRGFSFARSDSTDSLNAQIYLKAPYLAATGSPSMTNNGEVKINQSGMFWRGNGTTHQVMPMGGWANGTGTVTNTGPGSAATACTLSHALISTNSIIAINLLSDPGSNVGYPHYVYSAGQCIINWPVQFFFTTNLYWTLLK